MKNARQEALRCLYQIEYEGAYLNIALKKQLLSSNLDKRDKAFVTALVYGVVQQRLALEYVISLYSKVKIKKISKFILLILKLGIYQILFMDKIPDSALVNESVKLAKRYGHMSSAGFVNGLLRTVIKNKGQIPKPEDKYEALCVKHSFPKWIVEKWCNDFGEEFAASLMESLNKDAFVNVRVNTLKADKKEIMSLFPDAKEGNFSEFSLSLKGFDAVGSAEYKNGLITVQNEAAMLASEVLSPNPGEIVMDMCAAPGGKSTHIAQLMKNKGRVLSFDLYEHKIELINENAKRLGADIIEASVKDASVFDKKYENFADKILVDAPCSGLGIIRKKPDIKWNRCENEKFSDIQYKILTNAARYLKKGGELVYSTCTLNKEENEMVFEKFLKEHKDFLQVDISKYFSKSVKRDTLKEGYVTLYPNIDGTDGFFISKMKKV